jgi:hypothetical protein
LQLGRAQSAVDDSVDEGVVLGMGEIKISHGRWP